MKSLLLDRTTWDLVLDGNGNIAVCSEPYSVLQDVACAVRVFLGECYYDTSQGIPYTQKILGQYQSITIFKEQVRQIALGVPGVSDAQVALNGMDAARRLTGAIIITTPDGTTDSVGF